MNTPNSSRSTAAEPQITMVPVFSFNNSQRLTATVPSLSRPMLPQEDLHRQKYSQSIQNSSLASKTSCNCPHVLVADDDAFQHLYYQSLFTRSINLEDTLFTKHAFRFEMFFCGEQLLETLERTQHCGCDRPALIIVDYNMGSDKLNGVQTALKIRESGYKGPIVLRTSETQEYLRTRHMNFEQILKDGRINKLMDKDNISESKEAIQKYLTQKK